MDPSHQDVSTDDERVDEAVAESFPASDVPAWNATHAGVPVGRAPTVERSHEALRTLLRADVERLSRPIPDPELRRRMREEVLARAFLAAGRAVVREPLAATSRVRTLESDQRGLAREASSVIVSARYDGDDVSGIAALLAVSRGLADAQLLRNVRFVAFANSSSSAGSVQYVERLAASGASVHAMLSLARMDLSRDHEASLLFVGNLSSRRLVRTTARTFAMASRIGARALALPSWVPGVRASDHAAFWRYGWPAMMITERPPWRMGAPGAPDVDRIAAAVPGFIAVVVRLATA